MSKSSITISTFSAFGCHRHTQHDKILRPTSQPCSMASCTRESTSGYTYSSLHSSCQDWRCVQ
eukprot:5920784-Pleurochrysis_carterae.AAC.1